VSFTSSKLVSESANLLTYKGFYGSINNDKSLFFFSE